MNRTYDVSEIDSLIAEVHAKEGDGAFTSLGLMALEALIRTHDPDKRLPGKTLLRERINAYRSVRWPATAPKKIGSHRYW